MMKTKVAQFSKSTLFNTTLDVSNFLPPISVRRFSVIDNFIGDIGYETGIIKVIYRISRGFTCPQREK